MVRRGKCFSRSRRSIGAVCLEPVGSFKGLSSILHYYCAKYDCGCCLWIQLAREYRGLREGTWELQLPFRGRRRHGLLIPRKGCWSSSYSSIVFFCPSVHRYATSQPPNGSISFQEHSAILHRAGALTAIYSASKVVQKAVKQPIHPPTVTKLIARLIFYIPCLVADALERLLKEYKEEKGITWYVLGIEAVLVMMYFVVPLILELVQNYDGSLILDKPIYLGTQETHGSPEILYGAVLRDGDYDYSKARKHVYAISAWFRINPQPVSKTGPYSDDATILTFGDRPSVTYNNSTQRFKVLCKLSDSKTVSIYETTEIPLQSWTNIVINSDGANMTVFINGVLVASQPNIAPVTQYESHTDWSGGRHGRRYQEHQIQETYYVSCGDQFELQDNPLNMDKFMLPVYIWKSSLCYLASLQG